MSSADQSHEKPPPVLQEETGTRELDPAAVERAARAICDHDAEIEWDQDDHGEDRAHYTAMAEAALAAASLPSGGGERATVFVDELRAWVGTMRTEYEEDDHELLDLICAFLDERAAASPSGETGGLTEVDCAWLVSFLRVAGDNEPRAPELIAKLEALRDFDDASPPAGEADDAEFERLLDAAMGALDASCYVARDHVSGQPEQFDLRETVAYALRGALAAMPTGETGDGPGPREWTLCGVYDHLDQLIEVADGTRWPQLRFGEAVRVREIPSEGTRA